MPIIPSTYKPSLFFRNGHLSTIYPNLTRKVKGVKQTRERVELEDHDFIDLDWSYSTSKTSNLLILIHGLEGNGQRQYILGIAKHVNQNNWDAVAINLRNCSGEINRLYRSYNAGASDDLRRIVNHITSKYSYNNIALNGFSLGGNLILKYLGESSHIPSVIKAAVAISVPCDLHNSLNELNKPKNKLYALRFIKHLKEKLYERALSFPEKITKKDIDNCKTLQDIDDLYTSKAHGYKNALEYYKKCSSKQFLSQINIPTLIINAKNDSFLGEHCYPIHEASQSSSLFLEMPKYGGHVGFVSNSHIFYNEHKTLEFISSILK